LAVDAYPFRAPQFQKHKDSERILPGHPRFMTIAKKFRHNNAISKQSGPPKDIDDLLEEL